MPCLDELHGDIVAIAAVAGDRPADAHALGLDREGDVRQRERIEIAFGGVRRSVDHDSSPGDLAAALRAADLQLGEGHFRGAAGNRLSTFRPGQRRDGVAHRQLLGQSFLRWQGVAGVQLHRQHRLEKQADRCAKELVAFTDEGDILRPPIMIEAHRKVVGAVKFSPLHGFDLHMRGVASPGLKIIIRPQLLVDIIIPVIGQHPAAAIVFMEKA